jgi:molecular chaperone GrpE
VPQVDNQQIEAILQDFRDWLQRAAAEPRLEPAADDGAELIDLHTLASHFTALRHEVNLQTRAVRSQQEQNAQSLEKLGQALDLAQQAQKRASDTDEQLRPLVKTLLDTYDALALAKREVERIQGEATAPLPPIEIRLPFWARWLGAQQQIGQCRSVLEQHLAGENQRRQRLLDSILTGYTMSLGRLERTIAAIGLEPIAAVGEIFDPEQMEVVEVVQAPGRRNMEVVDEARRGYVWRGRVFRFAQVRVAKS